jgi:hypothetical protein
MHVTLLQIHSAPLSHKYMMTKYVIIQLFVPLFHTLVNNFMFYKILHQTKSTGLQQLTFISVENMAFETSQLLRD